MCETHGWRRAHHGHGHGHGGCDCGCGCGGGRCCCGCRGGGRGGCGCEGDCEGHRKEEPCAAEPRFVRRFKSPEEEIEELEEYKKELSRELSGVERRLKELRSQAAG